MLLDEGCLIGLEECLAFGNTEQHALRRIMKKTEKVPISQILQIEKLLLPYAFFVKNIDPNDAFLGQNILDSLCNEWSLNHGITSNGEILKPEIAKELLSTYIQSGHPTTNYFFHQISSNIEFARSIIYFGYNVDRENAGFTTNAIARPNAVYMGHDLGTNSTKFFEKAFNIPHFIDKLLHIRQRVFNEYVFVSTDESTQKLQLALTVNFPKVLTKIISEYALASFDSFPPFTIQDRIALHSACEIVEIEELPASQTATASQETTNPSTTSKPE